MNNSLTQTKLRTGQAIFNGEAMTSQFVKHRQLPLCQQHAHELIRK